ncbi:hypothetical protein BABA_25446 [Neobacillus bataviensis LMG 21833]|uniref:DUF2085 domain-containing protein n=1 Tax=Neobacillus bataviensis LMG 21833 TaxID=1117379 RepID=K6BUG8_9BACI|nr:DUF2085 domain-containing protein [Neobacillus bataviensis]EKN62555.1 hypothetical protein BABA_25446 [Neobacillus bataviensis LMG 21833]
MIQEVLHFFGRAICHQLEERSLHASGETLSVCARDTGIYIGIFSTLAYLHLFKRKKKITIPSIKMSFFLLLFMVPMAVDGLGSYAHLFESTNLRRLVSGTSFGFVLPYFLYPLLSAKALENESEPVIGDLKDFFVPVVLCYGLGGLVYWGKISYFVLDGLIILTVIVWFSMCWSFLFSRIQDIRFKSALSAFCGIAFLSVLSLLHSLIIP